MSNAKPKRPKALYTTRLSADVVEFLRARPNQAIWLEARVRATDDYDAWQITQPPAAAAERGDASSHAGTT